MHTRTRADVLDAAAAERSYPAARLGEVICALISFEMQKGHIHRFILANTVSTSVCGCVQGAEPGLMGTELTQGNRRADVFLFYFVGLALILLVWHDPMVNIGGGGALPCTHTRDTSSVVYDGNAGGERAGDMDEVGSMDARAPV